MHLKCPRCHTAGLLCAPDAQKNLTEQQRIGKHNIPEMNGMHLSGTNAGGTLTDGHIQWGFFETT